MTEAEDARHDVPPPPKGAGGVSRTPILFTHACADAEIRAKALELAMPMFEQAHARGVLNGSTLFDIADDIARYIKTGERPA